MQKIFLCAAILLLFFGCKKKTDSVDLEENYFPLKIGGWIVYNVDSTVYDAFTLQSHTHHLQLKEIITQTFTDGQGDLAYRLERYERDNDTLQFVIKNVWSEKVVNAKAEKVEENQRFVKLIFPPQISQSWQGNVYIAPNLTSDYTKFLTDWSYAYQSIDVAAQIGKFALPKTATVLDDNENIPGLQQTFFQEIYAQNIGLVYYHHKYVEKQPTDATWVSGFDVTAALNSYGGF